MGHRRRTHAAPVFRSLGGGDRPGAAGQIPGKPRQAPDRQRHPRPRSLRPERAIQVVDGREQDVAISALRLNDLVLVKPGERFPVDGEVSKARAMPTKR
jgi:hypothetical protein